ncbi:MAG: serine/threonine-protein kinase, partial [Polyangiaceae bacterium]
KEYLKRESRMTTRDAMSVVNQVASALTKTHEVGVIHRDIKPDNIFLLRTSSALVIKVLDFGVAKRLPGGDDDDLSLITSRHETLGTPAFMSPEQLRYASQVDHRTDIWSLGVLAYRLLMGALPFVARDYPAMCLAITQGTFTPPTIYDSRWPNNLDAWFTRAFQVDRESRFRSVEEASSSLALALSPVADIQPAGAEPDDELSARAALWEDADTVRRQR